MSACGGDDNPSTATRGWTWVAGPKEVAAGVYGQQGVASPDAMPGARDGAVTWSDASGQVWLFGGFGHADGGSQGRLNDLWRYDPAAKSWTWIGGSKAIDAAGVYGTEGRSAAGNWPGARYAPNAWRDSNGKVWLFGGSGFGESAVGDPGRLNDLWTYDASTNTWTWVGGSSGLLAEAVYGTKGVAAAGNHPGARAGAASWIDASGDLWLFSGSTASFVLQVDGTSVSAAPQELWRYSLATGFWTWVDGNAVAEIVGQSAGPVGRSGAVTWIDASGATWLFGGFGSDGFGEYAELSDLWKYDAGANHWTFVVGGQSIAPPPENASVPRRQRAQAVAAAASEPAIPIARDSASSWIDSKGGLWLFGGSTLQESLSGFTADQVLLSDLWRFDGSSSTWSLVAGTTSFDAPGVYGTKGQAAPDNVPSARSNAGAWIDKGGDKLWLFGGYGGTGDLWTYQP